MYKFSVDEMLMIHKSRAGISYMHQLKMRHCKLSSGRMLRIIFMRKEKTLDHGMSISAGTIGSCLHKQRSTKYLNQCGCYACRKYEAEVITDPGRIG
jgi:hypothetical protein